MQLGLYVLIGGSIVWALLEHLEWAAERIEALELRIREEYAMLTEAEQRHADELRELREVIVTVRRAIADIRGFAQATFGASRPADEEAMIIRSDSAAGRPQ